MAPDPTDRLERALLARLYAGGDASLSELAAELDVSRGAVASAYERLVRDTGTDPLLDRARSSLKSARALKLAS